MNADQGRYVVEVDHDHYSDHNSRSEAIRNARSAERATDGYPARRRVAGVRQSRAAPRPQLAHGRGRPMKRSQPVGSLCPEDPAHGPILDLDGRPYCPSQAHDEARIKRGIQRIAEGPWTPVEPLPTEDVRALLSQPVGSPRTAASPSADTQSHSAGEQPAGLFW